MSPRSELGGLRGGAQPQLTTLKIIRQSLCDKIFGISNFCHLINVLPKKMCELESSRDFSDDPLVKQ